MPQLAERLVKKMYKEQRRHSNSAFWNLSTGMEIAKLFDLFGIRSLLVTTLYVRWTAYQGYVYYYLYLFIITRLIHSVPRTSVYNLKLAVLVVTSSCSV